MKKVSVEKLNELYLQINGVMDLYLPVRKANEVNFGKFEEGVEVDVNVLQTVKSAKDLFFPQSENLMYFKTQGQSVEIKDDREESKPFAIFGVRGCDFKSFEVLDKVFLAEPVDSCYKTKRDNAVIITMACGKPQESCFCKNFGIDASSPKGDVETHIVDGFLYWNALTEKGKALTEKLTVLENADGSDEKKVEENKTQIKAIIEKLPFTNLDLSVFEKGELLDLFNRPEWEELSKACLGCGTCTFVCPTCQCFDIKDFKTNSGVKRFRCWDSCMYSEFTKMAAANPRTTQMQRFRQRFMHKLYYYPKNNDGLYSCVGCGRCVKKCPQSLNIVKVIKKLGGNK